MSSVKIVLNGCVVVAGSILFASAGCQSGPVIPEAVPITGSVTYNGEPVADAAVTFVSNDPNGKSGGGSTNASGSFKITTYFDPTHILEGAAAGDYRITVTKVPKPLDSFGSNAPQSQSPQSPIPDKYSKPETSDLKVTVTKGRGPVVLELKD